MRSQTNFYKKNCTKNKQFLLCVIFSIFFLKTFSDFPSSKTARKFWANLEKTFSSFARKMKIEILKRKAVYLIVIWKMLQLFGFAFNFKWNW